MTVFYDVTNKGLAYIRGGMTADFASRQITDDLYRLGVDVTFQQHITEQFTVTLCTSHPRKS